MQMTLALYIRLARTLEGREVSHVELGEKPLVVLRSLDRLLVAMEEQAELLRIHEAAPPELPTLEGEPTGETLTGEVIQEIVAPPDESPGQWTREYDLLYEDVMWLFRMQDSAGALSSVSRLLDVAATTKELRQFLELNESKLVSAYERALGPFDRPIFCPAVSLAEHYFYNQDEAELVLEAVRVSNCIRQVLEQSPVGRLQTLSLLYRFRNERILVVEGMELPTAVPGG